MLKDFAVVIHIVYWSEICEIRFWEIRFFNSGEISASLNLDGKVTWVENRFAKCEMRIEKVSAHNFRSDVYNIIVLILYLLS